MDCVCVCRLASGRRHGFSRITQSVLVASNTRRTVCLMFSFTGTVLLKPYALDGFFLFSNANHYADTVAAVAPRSTGPGLMINPSGPSYVLGSVAEAGEGVRFAKGVCHANATVPRVKRNFFSDLRSDEITR
jgi:hypothetical protein